MEVQCKCEMPPGATAPLAWLLFCPTLNHLCTLFVTTELGNHEPFVGQLVINVLVRHGLLWHLMRSWQIHKVCHSHELRLNILGMYCRAVEGQAQRAGAEVTLNLRRTYKVRCHVLHRPTFLKSDTSPHTRAPAHIDARARAHTPVSTRTRTRTARARARIDARAHAHESSTLT